MIKTCNIIVCLFYLIKYLTSWKKNHTSTFTIVLLIFNNFVNKVCKNVLNIHNKGKFLLLGKVVQMYHTIYAKHMTAFFTHRAAAKLHYNFTFMSLFQEYIINIKWMLHRKKLLMNVQILIFITCYVAI